MLVVLAILAVIVFGAIDVLFTMRTYAKVLHQE